MAPSKLALLQWISSRKSSVAALVLASGLLGCATQAQTGQLLSAAGTAAVIAGAVMASDGCYEYERGYDVHGRPCGGGGMSGAEKAGLAVAVAGLATTAIGNALQEDAARLDARRRSSPSPTYTATTLPPPAFAPSGTFNLYGAPTVVLTSSCTCPEPEPEPVAEPPCTTGSGEGQSGATAESTSEGAPPAAGASGEASAPASPRAGSTACPCAWQPGAAPSTAPEPAAPAPSEGEAEAAPSSEEPAPAQ
jgi:hypothetical protein